MCGMLSNKTVKTRKKHLCTGCRRIIPAGTVMDVAAIKDGRRIYNTYFCPVCEKYAAENKIDECYEGQLRDGDPEGWEEVRREIEELEDNR